MAESRLLLSLLPPHCPLPLPPRSHVHLHSSPLETPARIVQSPPQYASLLLQKRRASGGPLPHKPCEKDVETSLKRWSTRMREPRPAGAQRRDVVWLRKLERLEVGAPWGGGRRPGPTPLPSLPHSPHWPGSQNFQKDRSKTKESRAGRGIFSRCACGLAALGLSFSPRTPTLAEGGGQRVQSMVPGS